MTQRTYPFFGKPPAKEPRPAADEPALWGKRVILSMPYGFVYDQRACSEPYANEYGNTRIDICSEEHWYRWMYTAEPPERQPYPLHLVWVE